MEIPIRRNVKLQAFNRDAAAMQKANESDRSSVSNALATVHSRSAFIDQVTVRLHCRLQMLGDEVPGGGVVEFVAAFEDDVLEAV